MWVKKVTMFLTNKDIDGVVWVLRMFTAWQFGLGANCSRYRRSIRNVKVKGCR